MEEPQWDQDRIARRRRTARIVVAAAAINFALYAGLSFCLGGSALRGPIENGRYYLLDQHERSTAVSPQVYYLSKGWGWLVIASLPALIGSYVVLRRREANDGDLR